ncbi:hypothetical protein [Streptomyces hesseae]|uniref:Scaffolding protein n=1 Tax=Streptomyces hesseae TaxID=3075519 RepID=A0ABU2SRH5_9ACTN|nr:hypothetical protein [Streptomyces sp. DSM 40473]MDT0450949.1 hypothetical protein [Streptomyces sp. DSM 40473]
MAEVENTPETPQGAAVSPTEATEVESTPEVEVTPDAGAEGLSGLTAELEASRAETEEMRTALAEAESRAKAAEVALERERAARRNGLPDELVSFLRGESAEELAAEAATLAKYASAGSAGIGTGGLDPTDTGDGGIVARIVRKSREL